MNEERKRLEKERSEFFSQLMKTQLNLHEALGAFKNTPEAEKQITIKNMVRNSVELFKATTSKWPRYIVFNIEDWSEVEKLGVYKAGDLMTFDVTGRKLALMTLRGTNIAKGTAFCCRDKHTLERVNGRKWNS